MIEKAPVFRVRFPVRDRSAQGGYLNLKSVFRVEAWSCQVHPPNHDQFTSPDPKHNPTIPTPPHLHLPKRFEPTVIPPKYHKSTNPNQPQIQYQICVLKFKRITFQIAQISLKNHIINSKSGQPNSQSQRNSFLLYMSKSSTYQIDITVIFT